MAKGFVMLIVMCITGGIWVAGGGQADAAGYSLQAAVVVVPKANVYTEPRLSAPITASLTKGETFPITAYAAGDSGAAIYHRVSACEHLTDVSAQYGVSAADLRRVNNLRSDVLNPEQLVRIPQQQLPGGYVRLQMLGGHYGWVRQALTQQKKLSPIVMGWNAAGSTSVQLSRSNKPNLGVVSPRWYYLSRAAGGITVKENAEFVKKAHQMGKRVWPLLGNLFDPALTDEFLSRPANRQRAAALIRDSLIRTGADGINIDFENIDPHSADDFVMFIRELRMALEPRGKPVSVDVTRTNADPFWSGSYNRAALGGEADYIVMMGYDEHWSGGTNKGPVASMPWVRQGLAELMKEVPSHKIILGVPFYTREWITNLSTGAMQDHDRTMGEVAAIVKERKLKPIWDPNAEQYVVRYTAGGSSHEMWLENKLTMQRRYALVKTNRLRGIAAWSLGSETPDIWPVFAA